MIKLTKKFHDNTYQDVFYKVSDIKAIKVINGETHVFLHSKGHILGKHIIVKDTPHDIGMRWISDLVNNGKEIGINGVL